MSDQQYVAQQDIPAPGYDDPLIVAFRAGDVIPPEWFEQHQSALKELAQGGPELVAKVSPAKVGDAAEKARAAQ
jgi:hypothetical protein